MKLSISRRKIYAVSIMFLLIIFQCFSIGYANLYPSYEDGLRIISIVCMMSFFLEIIIWRYVSKELFSPYLVLFVVLFVFTCGQSIGWATGIEMSKNLMFRADHGLNTQLLFQGLSYSMLSISFFQIGAILGSFTNSYVKRLSKWKAGQVTTAYRNLGKILIILCIPAFIAKTGQNIQAVLANGYTNYFAVNQARSTLMSLVDFVADWYQPCLLILLVAYRNSDVKRRIIVGAMLVDVVLSLIVGGRSGAVMTIMGMLLTYHYFVRPFKLKQACLGFGFGYVGMAIMNSIAVFRGETSRSLSRFISVLADSFSNVLGDFIGELGWTLTSICWTMRLVPSTEPFRYGLSYLTGLLSWVPSFVFGGRANHPSVLHSNLAEWLADTNHMSYGPGYTTIAESYINFGYLGLIAMLVEGIIIAKFVAQIRKRDVEKNLIGSTFQVLMIMVLMKSTVRSSFSVAFRSFVFVLIPILLLIRFTLRKKRSKKRS